MKISSFLFHASLLLAYVKAIYPPAPLPQTNPLQLAAVEGYLDPNFSETIESWSVPDKFYRLTQIRLWKKDGPSWGIQGFEVTFSPPASFVGWNDVTKMFGQVGDQLEVKQMNDNIVEVSICVDNWWGAESNQYNRDLERLKFRDDHGNKQVFSKGAENCAEWIDLGGKLIGFWTVYGYHWSDSEADYYDFRSAAVIIDQSNCEDATPQDNIADMTFEIGSSVPSEQDITNIVLSTVYGESCTFTANLDESSLFASLTATDISIYSESVVDVGIYDFNLILTLDNVASFVEPLSIPFKITINQCQVTQFSLVQVIPDQTYELYSGILAPSECIEYSITPSQCELYYVPASAQVTYIKDGVSVFQPAFITFDEVNQKFSFESEDENDIGQYQITIVNQISFNNMQVTSTILVTVQVSCGMGELTVLGTMFPYATYSYDIGHPTDTRTIMKNDFTSTTTSDSCPPIIYLMQQTGFTGATDFDETVFSLVDLNSEQISFDTFTTDLSKAGLQSFRLTISYDTYTNNDFVDFTVNIRDPCGAAVMTIDPSILVSTELSYSIYKPADVQTLDTALVTSSEASPACPSITLNIIMTNGLLLDPEVFAFNPVLHTFVTETSDFEKVGLYELEVTAQYEGAIYINVQGTLEFTVMIEDPCALVPLVILPSIIPSSILSYIIGTPDSFYFSQAYIQSDESPCPTYYFTLEDQDGEDIDTEVFNHTEGSNQLRINSTDIHKRGQYPMRLKVRYSGPAWYYTRQDSLNFIVELIDPCLTEKLMIDQSVMETTSIQYSVYKPAHIELIDLSAITQSQTIVECPVIVLDIMNQDDTRADADIFTYNQFNREIKVQTNDASKTGTYSLKLLAFYEGGGYQVSEQQFTVQISDPCEKAVISIDKSIVPSTITYTVGQFVQSITFDDKKVDSTEADCPSLVFTFQNYDGDTVDPQLFTQVSQMLKIYTEDEAKIGSYPIQLTVSFQSNTALYENSGHLNFQVEIISANGDFDKEPLFAQSYSVNSQGLLSMQFNYPLAELPSTEKEEEEEEEDQFEQLLKLSVVSSTFDPEDQEIQITNSTLVKFNGTIIEVQVEFKSPASLSLSAVFPELLEVSFKEQLRSIDQNTQESGTTLLVTIPQQFNPSEMEALEQFKESVERPVVYFSALQLVLNLAIGAGLKHMWKVINVLQFVVFFLIWQINVPSEASIFIEQVRNLAFFEFVTDWIFDWLATEEDDCLDAEEVECDVVNTQSSIDRLGSDNFLKNAGFMALAGLGLIVGLVALGLLFTIGLKSQKANYIYREIKQHMVWNGLIRYVLQSNLKLQMAAATVLAVSTQYQLETSQSTSRRRLNVEPESTSNAKVIPYILLIIMNLTPFLFVFALYKYRTTLKTEGTKKTIGSLYQTVQPINIQSLSYSIVFLLRRSFFVLITYTLFTNPALQTQIQIVTILLYIAYTQIAIVYESPIARRTEFCNEGIFLLTTYHMMFFASTWLYEERTAAGWSLIIIIVAMIVGNYAVIIVLSFHDFKYRFKMWKLMKQRKTIINETNQALEQLRIVASNVQDQSSLNQSQVNKKSLELKMIRKSVVQRSNRRLTVLYSNIKIDNVAIVEDVKPMFTKQELASMAIETNLEKLERLVLQPDPHQADLKLQSFSDDSNQESQISSSYNSIVNQPLPPAPLTMTYHKSKLSSFIPFTKPVPRIQQLSVLSKAQSTQEYIPYDHVLQPEIDMSELNYSRNDFVLSGIEHYFPSTAWKQDIEAGRYQKELELKNKRTALASSNSLTDLESRYKFKSESEIKPESEADRPNIRSNADKTLMILENRYNLNKDSGRESNKTRFRPKKDNESNKNDILDLLYRNKARRNQNI